MLRHTHSMYRFVQTGRIHPTRRLPITLLAVALTAVLCPAIEPVARAQTDQLLFDRELPVLGLGGPRNAYVGSFVGTTAIVGDDIALPPGDYLVDHIRTWGFFGAVDDPTYDLGNWFNTGKLYFGRANMTPYYTIATPLSTVAKGNFLPGSNQTDNPDVTFTRAKFPSPSGPVDLRPTEQLWQMDFTNLHLFLHGGTLYTYGAGAQSNIAGWQALLTVTSLSGSRQDGADGLVHAIYEPQPLDLGVFDYGNVDNSVQVFGTPLAVPEPGALSFGALGLLCVADLLRRRRQRRIRA